MPMPIQPIGNKGDESPKQLQMDYSFLFPANQPVHLDEVPQSNPKIVTASNKDADLLLELWLTSEKKENGAISIPKDSKFSSGDILRLKTHGLVTGGAEEVQFTNRGRIVITTMVLSENNRFLKNQKSKKYTEILASMSKKGKKGYRMPSFAANSHLLQNSPEDNTTKE